MHQPHFNCSGFRHRPCLVDHIGDPKSIPSRCNESVWIITLLGPLKKLQYMCLYWSRLLYCCIFSVLFFLTARATKGFGGTSLYLHFTERKVSIELSLSLTICLYNSTYIYMQIWMHTYALLMQFMWCSRRADQLPNQLKSSRSASRPEMIWPSGRTRHFFEPKNPIWGSPSEHMPNLVQTCSKTTCSSTMFN